jgi:hypothetical protein
VVCRDPKLHQITRDLAAGVSHSAVARKFNLTQPMVSKHVKLHMGDALAQFNLCAPVIDQIKLLSRRCQRILDEADRAGKWKNPTVALQAIRELRNNHELIAKLTGELRSTGPTNEPVVVRIEYIDKQLVVESNNQSNTPPPAIETAESA